MTPYSTEYTPQQCLCSFMHAHAPMLMLMHACSCSNAYAHSCMLLQQCLRQPMLNKLTVDLPYDQIIIVWETELNSYKQHILVGYIVVSMLFKKRLRPYVYVSLLINSVLTAAAASGHNVYDGHKTITFRNISRDVMPGLRSKKFTRILIRIRVFAPRHSIGS